MLNFFRLGARLHKDEKGATAIEYGLLAALIAVVLIGGASFLGTSLDAKFDQIGTTVAGAGGAPAAGSGSDTGTEAGTDG